MAESTSPKPDDPSELLNSFVAATLDDLEELIGSVAAEANHEPNRRRQRRLDCAFDALNSGAQTSHRW